MKLVIDKIFLWLVEYFRPNDYESKFQQSAIHIINNSQAYSPVSGLSSVEYVAYFIGPVKRKTACNKNREIRYFEIGHYWNKAACYFAFIVSALFVYITFIPSQKYPQNLLTQLNKLLNETKEIGNYIQFPLAPSEEGTLTNSFWDSGILTIKEIGNETILVYSLNKSLSKYISKNYSVNFINIKN